jgi:glutaconate CoA-transferase subunit A
MRDNAAYLEWDEISADRDRFLAWMDEHVIKAGPEVFARRIAASGRGGR